MADTTALSAAMGTLMPNNPGAARREQAPPSAARLAEYNFPTDPAVAVWTLTDTGGSIMLELFRHADLPMVLW